jgi:ribonuclease BN (tRNA processing enzyme)
VSGQSYLRYGGHTACVAVTTAGAVRPSLLLDAGTGLQNLAPLLGDQPFRGAIVLSHLHWDHMQGLPFFRAGDRDDAVVDVYLPAQEGRTGSELLAQSMSPPAFPIAPEGLQGDWNFHAIEPDTHAVDSFTVTAAQVLHKGGRTFGYRVQEGSTAVAYLPDHVAIGDDSDEVLSLLRGCDVLIHDAQFIESERRLANDYGHSTINDAIDLAVRLDVKRLVLFHHAPSRSDDQLDQLMAGLNPPLPVEMAREGLVLHLGSAP